MTLLKGQRTSNYKSDALSLQHGGKKFALLNINTLMYSDHEWSTSIPLTLCVVTDCLHGYLWCVESFFCFLNLCYMICTVVTLMWSESVLHWQFAMLSPMCWKLFYFLELVNLFYFFHSINNWRWESIKNSVFTQKDY